MQFKVVIPARYGASRLPGKPLRDLAGKPLLQHVHERAAASGAEVLVATDDPRIADAALAFGARVCMTAADHPSGTARIAEVVAQRGWPDGTLVVNLQGDEPLVPPGLLRDVAADLDAQPAADMATLATPLRGAAELFDPNVVKVVTDGAGFALYFSRAPIPWDRERFAAAPGSATPGPEHRRHVGIYAYRAGFLRRYAALAASPLESLESLEQLRVLWHGGRIHVAEAAELPGHGVDTEADLQRVAALLAAGSTP
ncbi:MAG TPA: 3-deoxy-manno-octulosonate cytidylyltransferase [Gammaproteobacteria bacterium]